MRFRTETEQVCQGLTGQGAHMLQLVHILKVIFSQEREDGRVPGLSSTS